MDGVVVKVVSSKAYPQPTQGSAGLATQVAGAMASVSNLAGATGGIKPGTLAQRDIK